MKIPVLGWTVDERFLRHRLRSTSAGGLAGVLLATILFVYQLITHHIYRWDLFAILLTAAAVKMAFLFWYRLHD